MLSTIKYQEQYEAVGNELYAVIKETGQKRLVNEDGCEYLKEITDKICLLDNEIKNLKNALTKVEHERICAVELKGKLYGMGFCEMTEKMKDFDLNTGAVINEYTDHNRWCRNNKKNKGRAK